MTKGRKPLPTTLKLLAGNPGKRKLPTNQLATVEVPDCPEHLDKNARAEWDRITVELVKAGLLTRLDRTALALYCQTFSRWVEAETKVRTKGAVIRTANGYPIQNPWLNVATSAAKDLKGFLVEFGLTPSSRSRLECDAGSKPEDPLANFTRKRESSA